MDWYPEPGEVSQWRVPARFASGLAAPVLGLRSFRDPGRHDIQGELPGWPHGAPFAPRTKGDQAAGRVAGGIFRAVPVAIGVLVEAFGGNTYGKVGSAQGKGKPQDPQDEVEDFPVMWAAPGTVARTLPWQLDPARAPERFRTDLVVTGRRLVILGRGPDPTAPAQVLWELPRDQVAGAERREFSHDKADVRITFTDGSWIRLFTGTAGNATRLTQLLEGTARALTPTDLSEGQRTRLDTFLAGLPAEPEPPAVISLPSGVVLVEAKVPHAKAPGGSLSHFLFMDAEGKPTAPRPGDL